MGRRMGWLKKKTTVLMLASLLLLNGSCTAETLSYQESNFVNELKEHFSAAALFDEGRHLEQTIQNDVFCERFEDLVIRVAHVSGDMNCLIAEVVVSCDTENVILKTWEDPKEETIDNLNNTNDQTIYYINVDTLSSCDAWSDYSFDNGICFTIWNYYKPFYQLEDSISDTIIVRVGIVSPNRVYRELKEYRIPVTYDLMRPLACFAYDTSSEPITEEIFIRTLQIIQTGLQVIEIFEYETVSDEYYAKLEYWKPTIRPPEKFELRIYKGKEDELVKIIEFKIEGSYLQGQYVPVRYWLSYCY